MKQVLRTISFLGLFLFIEGFLLSVLARTETTNKEVLVLNSINFNLPWAKNFYWCIHDALQKQGISAKAESLSVPALVNKMEADAVVTHLREKYPVAPAAIVLIGDPGWIVCRELFDDVWKDVPVIVTNARDRLPASLDVLLSHAPLTETNSVPGEEWRRGYNLTLLKQHYYVKETVELIYKLIPDMQRLAFISDDRYISEETRRDVKEAVEENFPDLRLDLLSTTQLSTEMLLDTLHSYKPNTGIIYYSWFESHNENDNNYLFDHIQEIITNFTPSPLFLLSPENLSNNTFAGGYYVSTESFCDSLLEILNRILNGEQAPDPKETIDYIAASKQNATGFAVISARVVNEPMASDHRPILVELRTAEKADKIFRTKPYLQNPVGNGITVMWETTVPSYCWVEYGTDTTRLERARMIVDGQVVCNNKLHKIRIDGLQPGQKYYYRV